MSVKLCRLSFVWPSEATRYQAERSFDAAFLAYEAEVGALQAFAADGSDGDLELDVDQMEIWKRVGRGGAPPFVRENAWLLLAWGLWCAKKEEPALVWIGWVAGLLMAVTAAYPGVRWVVALMLGAGGT